MRPRLFLTTLIILLVLGCAPANVKQFTCFGFCTATTIQKEEVPEHVTETIKQVIKNKQSEREVIK
jgi:hypothetical protein